MLTAGPIIDGTGSLYPESLQPLTESEMRAMVRQQVARGVDSVKLYMNVHPELLRAGIEEAPRLGATAIGHVKKTSWTQAARAGIDTLVHSGSEGPVWELLGEGAGREFESYSWGESFRQWALRSADFDLQGSRMRELVQVLVTNHVEINPTLVLLETHGARALGIEDRAGTVQTGKIADLVVLYRNPLEDIRHTRSIELVLLRGRSIKPENSFSPPQG